MARSPLDPHGALAPMTRPPLTEEERIAYEQRLALAQDRTAIDVPPPITPDPVPLQTMDAMVPEGFDPAAAPPPSLPVQTMETTAPAGFDPSALEPATGGMPEAYESGVAQPATPLASLARTQDPAAIMAPVQEKAAEVSNSLQSLARTPEATSPAPERFGQLGPAPHQPPARDWTGVTRDGEDYVYKGQRFRNPAELDHIRHYEAQNARTASRVASPGTIEHEIANDVRPSGQLPERAPWGDPNNDAARIGYSRAMAGLAHDSDDPETRGAWETAIGHERVYGLKGHSAEAIKRQEALDALARPKPEDPRIQQERIRGEWQLEKQRLQNQGKKRPGGGGPARQPTDPKVVATMALGEYQDAGVPPSNMILHDIENAKDPKALARAKAALRADISAKRTSAHRDKTATLAEDKETNKRRKEYQFRVAQSGLPQVEAVMGRLDKNIRAAIESQGEIFTGKDEALRRGPSSFMGFASETAKPIVADIQRLQNLQIKDMSGAAVTVHEMPRVQRAFGTGVFSSEADLQRYLKAFREEMDAVRNTYRAGFTDVWESVEADQRDIMQGGSGGGKEPGRYRIRKDDGTEGILIVAADGSERIQ